MKLRSISRFASGAALAALLPLGISNTHAVSAAAAPVAGVAVVQPPPLQRVEWKDGDKEKLRHAYWLLEIADHDYRGHKANAMEQIKKAGDIIGIEIHGRKNESWATPPTSDERVHRARALLQELASESGGKEFEHLHNAIHELDHALEVH